MNLVAPPLVDQRALNRAEAVAVHTQAQAADVAPSTPGTT
jgi:hypothetical protein